MGVSENSGTPKSSISIRFSIINHPFWGTPIFGNTPIWWRWYLEPGGIKHLNPPQKAESIIHTESWTLWCPIPNPVQPDCKLWWSYQDWCSAMFAIPSFILYIPIENCPWPCQHISIMTISCFYGKKYVTQFECQWKRKASPMALCPFLCACWLMSLSLIHPDTVLALKLQIWGLEESEDFQSTHSKPHVSYQGTSQRNA